MTARYFVFTEGFRQTFAPLTKFAFCRGLRKSRMRVHFAVSHVPYASVWTGVTYLCFRTIIDLMWSDPDDVENWAVSPRGAGWLFGASITREVRPPLFSFCVRSF